MESELIKYDYDILQAMAQSEGIDNRAESKQELIQRIISHREATSLSTEITLESLDITALRDIANRIGYETETRDKDSIINAIEGYRNLEKLPLDELRAAASGTEKLLKLRSGILFKNGTNRPSILGAFVDIMNERERARIALAHFPDTYPPEGGAGMTSDEEKPDIISSLVSMGIDFTTARQAALRFSSIEGAMDWIISKQRLR